MRLLGPRARAQKAYDLHLPPAEGLAAARLSDQLVSMAIEAVCIAAAWYPDARDKRLHARSMPWGSGESGKRAA